MMLVGFGKVDWLAYATSDSTGAGLMNAYLRGDLASMGCRWVLGVRITCS